MGKVGVVRAFPSRRVPNLDHLLVESYSYKYPVNVADVNRDIKFTEREYSERYLLAPLPYTVVIVSGALLEENCPEEGAESMHAWASAGHNNASEEIYHLIVNPEPLVQ